jgi:hypothetical protein
MPKIDHLTTAYLGILFFSGAALFNALHVALPHDLLIGIVVVLIIGVLIYILRKFS